MTLKRISVTIPRHILEAADSRARDLDRSRSWVVAEALRRFLGLQRSDGGGALSHSRVREQTSSPPGHETSSLGEYRLRQLDADLSMTADERVAAAENTALVTRLRSARWERDRVLTFDRYEDYLD